MFIVVTLQLISASISRIRQVLYYEKTFTGSILLPYMGRVVCPNHYPDANG